jgi:cysteine-rich repeat protein
MREPIYLVPGLLLVVAMVACGDDESAGPGASSSSGQGAAASSSNSSSGSGQASGGAGSCGDGEEASGEECDDGNSESYDGCSVLCQTEELAWEQLTEAPSFVHGDMVDDGDDLFAFYTEVGPVAHSERLIGGEWVELEEPELTVPSQTRPALEYDSSNDRTILFISDETWEHAGGQWTYTAAGPTDGARTEPAMVYDSSRDRIVLFGGQSEGDVLDDTWIYEDGGWYELFPPTFVQGRYNASMVYDEARDRVVLYGGCHDFAVCALNNGGLIDTMEFDGTDWELIETTDSPTNAQGLPAAYDPQRQVTVLVDNEDGTVYEYDGTNYTVPPLTGPEDASAATYSATHHGVVVAGSNGVWVLGYR